MGHPANREMGWLAEGDPAARARQDPGPLAPPGLRCLLRQRGHHRPFGWPGPQPGEPGLKQHGRLPATGCARTPDQGSGLKGGGLISLSPKLIQIHDLHRIGRP